MDQMIPAFYDMIMDQVEWLAYFLADQLAQIAVMFDFDLSAAMIEVLDMVLGIARLAWDYTDVFPWYFHFSLMALILSFFISLIIRAIITFWRVLPFTG